MSLKTPYISDFQHYIFFVLFFCIFFKQIFDWKYYFRVNVS